MKLSEIGEFGFIDRFSGKFSALNKNEEYGIGDDCAIMPLDDQYNQIVTTDLLIEDIHFLRSAITPFDLGYKALAVNLSDIAAMGGTPSASFLSIALPADTEVEYMDQVMEGYRSLSEKYRVPLLGGDTTKSPDKIVINVCVTGKVLKGKAKLRSSAMTGDYICVSGPLGDSAAGLNMLLNNINPDNQTKNLISWHNRPEPAITEGLWLGRQEGVNAMMDISDGIASDLKHILTRSGKGAVIHLENIPLSEALRATSRNNTIDVLKFALSGGEDYRLLFTVQSQDFEKIKKDYNKHFQTPLTCIGKITEENPGEIMWMQENRPFVFQKGGFNHFSQ
ncbi:thiamine-phosphate kinase [Marinilabilia salmonicolor]|jgi:thiamine-monophosphate kinase|uniref:Thiamine-monophosphate kinase n=1 Tax=Marinilabilia salmonicolor TaxID=989 RepID=A0A2T0XMA8_9BACT|nr:thiamine-phosphate kinase [Marinilabilia salmonicolor]PRZ00061.1 thiamine-monophosphate kinase [Marinilabilia salmonicolor]RCW38688.1 thiamine-monophosphate kinase [Marinilabilia salmonicolor]